MRRVPVAVCLAEGGMWLPWRSHNATAPIKIYANGKVKDRILGHNRRYTKREMLRLRRVIRY